MPETRHVEIGDLTLGNDRPLILIAGPCVLESRAHALETSRALAEMAAGLGGRAHLRLALPQPTPRNRLTAFKSFWDGLEVGEGATERAEIRSQKVSVAAPSLMSECIGAAPVTTVPSMRSSSS